MYDATQYEYSYGLLSYHDNVDRHTVVVVVVVLCCWASRRTPIPDDAGHPNRIAVASRR